MELIIRKITFADFDEITELYVETYKKEPWYENWEKEFAKEKVKNAIENSHAENYCISKNNIIIGVMLAYRFYYINKIDLYIEDFFVEYSTQKKGIGKYFLENIEKEMKQKNFSSMVLLTKKAFPSEFFYTKNGFGTSTDMILMYKEIQ